jgi:hypothetical protein
VATLLAVASSWSYSDAATLCRAIGRHGIDNHVEHFAVRNDAMLVDANAFIITSRDNDLIIVSFRGTPPQDIIDWLVDASVMPTQFGGSGHAHGGFYNNVSAVWDVVAARLTRIIREYRQKAAEGQEKRPGLPAVFITGHSLGAAMAALAAAITFEDQDYSLIRDHVCGVYTYGQPMIGDRILAEQCEGRFGNITFRHVYKEDIVPQLPPRTTGEFQHFGQEYSSAPGGWSLRHRPLRQLGSLLLSLPIATLAWVAKQFPYLAGISFPWSIADHSPLNYLETSLRGNLRPALAQVDPHDASGGEGPSVHRDLPPVSQATHG